MCNPSKLYCKIIFLIFINKNNWGHDICVLNAATSFLIIIISWKIANHDIFTFASKMFKVLLFLLSWNFLFHIIQVITFYGSHYTSDCIYNPSEA